MRRADFEIFLIGSLVGTLLGFSVDALSATRPTHLPTQRKGGAKPRVLESYPALVDEAGEGAQSESLVEAPIEVTPAPAETRVQRRAAARKTVKREKAAKEKALPYDLVPETLTPALERRLELTRELITEHGRAYDYRTHTVKQLEAIKEQLDIARLPAPPPPDLD